MVRTYVAPTDRQISYARALAGERVAPDLGATAEERVAALDELLGGGRLDKFGLMDVIDALKDAPRDQTATSDEALTPGVYERNGEVYVVKPNRAKTSLYAKRMIEIGGRRLTEAGTVENLEFEYAPGAIRQLRPADRMPLERARELTVRYGRCLNCGRRLKDATSVERGIGPVCLKAFRA